MEKACFLNVDIYIDNVSEVCLWTHCYNRVKIYIGQRVGFSARERRNIIKDETERMNGNKLTRTTRKDPESKHWTNEVVDNIHHVANENHLTLRNETFAPRTMEEIPDGLEKLFGLEEEEEPTTKLI